MSRFSSPRFSICVSSYKDEEYLTSCMESVLRQPLHNLELIVVDDGSPDGTADLIREFAKRDSRVVPIIKEKNEGVHLGRKSAVEKSLGKYIILLDSDDELGEDCLYQLDKAFQKNPCDMIHFGMQVVNSGIANEEAQALETYINTPVEDLYGKDICYAAYSSECGYRQDFRITQRAFRGDFLRSVYAKMTTDRLGRTQDSYEAFVALSSAKSQITRNDILALKYFYGRGLNAYSELTIDAFLKAAHGFWDTILHMEEYASSFADWDITPCLNGGRSKLLELLFNDWRVRVSDKNKIEAAKAAANFLGQTNVAAQLMRLVRDQAYELWVSGKPLLKDNPILSWYSVAKAMAASSFASSARLLSFYSDANTHIANLCRRTKMQDYENQDIRIFVTIDNPVNLFDSSIIQPIQIKTSSNSSRSNCAFYDNTGENIANKSALYGKLTAQYWAWKNTSSKYVGFCEHDCYFGFDFSGNDWAPASIEDKFINADSQNIYGLDDEAIREFVEQYDVMVAAPQHKNNQDSCEQHKHTNLYKKDLESVISILKSKYPQYCADVDAFIDSSLSYTKNMFIMKREIFNNYSEWLFTLLQEFIDSTDMSLYSKESLLTPQYLATDLLGIYLEHISRTSQDIKITSVTYVNFKYPSYQSKLDVLIPAEDKRPLIPVVFASDNNYVPMLTTTIYSALCNASAGYHYDVVILHKNITEQNQAKMHAFFEKFNNATLRFYDVEPIVEKYDLSTNNPHISVETYYRFLIQKLLPQYNKVLYLDSDLIIKGDIARLFNTELGDNLLAAVRDVDFLGNLNIEESGRIDYAQNVLKMQNPYNYFQAGVLVLNTEAMRKLCSIQTWFEYASNDEYIYNDQDVLNALCEGRVTWLNYSWNVMIDCNNRIANIFAHAPAEVYDAFLDSIDHEQIVHYAGFEKPWKFCYCDQSDLYWEYASKTPFYKNLLAMLYGCDFERPVYEDNEVEDEVEEPEETCETEEQEEQENVDEQDRQDECCKCCDVVEETNSNVPLQWRVIDSIVPEGTTRREVAKSIYHIVKPRREDVRKNTDEINIANTTDNADNPNATDSAGNANATDTTAKSSDDQ